MAAYTKIVEFFGIPACGKTTLSNYLCDYYRDRMKVTTMGQLVKEAKQHMFKLYTANPWANVVAAQRLRKKTERNGIKYLGWPSHDKYYAYAKKYTDYDIVLADHGDIQSIVSLEQGKDLHKEECFLKACSNYLEVSLADIYVYCKLDASQSLERMRQRGRNSGRIDVMNDDKAQFLALDEERTRFDFFANLLRGNSNLFELNMEAPTELIAQELIMHLKREI